MDADGNLVWAHDLPQRLSNLSVKLASSDGGFLFADLRHDVQEINAIKVNGDGLLDPICNQGNVLPDLSLYNLQFNGNVFSVGDEIPITFDVHNNAIGIANNYSVGIYLRPAPFNTIGNDIFLTSIDLTDTPLGVEYIPFNITFPNIAEASYQLVLKPVSYTHLTLPTTPYV